MKTIGNLTEDQAIAVAALAVTYRVVRGTRVVRETRITGYTRFAVEVDTYSAEETVGRVIA